MLNNPPPEKRRVHPLEDTPPQSPQPMPGETPPQQRHPITLHIPSVRPTVTYALLAINIAIFAIRALSPSLDEQLFLWGANQRAGVLINGQFYRLFTSMFLHASIYDGLGRLALANSLHLIFNCYVLYQVGTAVERLFGHARFALIYALGGLAGSVTSVVLGDSRAYSVGASGVVFAVLGAELVYLYQHRRLLGAGGRTQMQSVITFMIINFAFGILTTLGDGAIRVDNWAHLGGAAGGAALEKRKQEKEAQGEIETEHPGYLGAQDTYYVGTIKGVGRIYQQTFIDTYSKVVFAKLYDRKNALVAADLLLDEWVEQYNRERTHTGKYCFRRTPLQTFRETKHLAQAKQLDTLFEQPDRVFSNSDETTEKVVG